MRGKAGLSPFPLLLGFVFAASVGACALPAVRGGGEPAGPATIQGRLAADAVWRGTVILADDFQVPRGRTLRIKAGTRVIDVFEEVDRYKLKA